MRTFAESLLGRAKHPPAKIITLVYPTAPAVYFHAYDIRILFDKHFNLNARGVLWFSKMSSEARS